MSRLVIYIHGKGGNAKDAEHILNGSMTLLFYYEPQK